MTKLANTDNSQYSAHFGSSTVPSCAFKGGKKRRTFRKKSMKKRNMKKRKSMRKRKSVKRRKRRTRRTLKGGSYTLAHDDGIKMGPKGGLGQFTKSDMNPSLDLISNPTSSTGGDLNNLQGQAGGKRRRRSRKSRKNRMRGGTGPVGFGYSTGGSELNSLAEANPPPHESYNSCQKADYIH
jgi:hypothetical protein